MPVSIKKRTEAATTAPNVWDTIYPKRFLGLKRPAAQRPKETAGLKCAPEICPRAYAMVRTVIPKANETPIKPIPDSGNLAEKIALPQPPKTNQNVPKNSA